MGLMNAETVRCCKQWQPAGYDRSPGQWRRYQQCTPSGNNISFFNKSTSTFRPDRYAFKLNFCWEVLCSANIQCLSVFVFTLQNGWTPLMTAIYNGHVEVVAFLLERGANPKLASIQVNFRHRRRYYKNHACNLFNNSPCGNLKIIMNTYTCSMLLFGLHYFCQHNNSTCPNNLRSYLLVCLIFVYRMVGLPCTVHLIMVSETSRPSSLTGGRTLTSPTR